MSNYYKNTGTKISEYPNAPINSKYFKGKFDNTHYFISYAPTNYGITSVNKNFKVSINALRTDMLGYIGIQNAKGNWQDYIVVWQGDWYNEDKKNSYLYQWNIGQISSRHYIRNKHGLDKNDKGELLDVINNTKRVFLLNNAPLPLEQGEHVDPNPHNLKIVDKKYIDDRFNGIRKVSVNNQTIQIRPYTCLYEVSTTNKVTISDTLTLSDGRSIKDCIKDNCLIFYVKLPENTNGIDGTWSYTGELNDVKKSVGGSLVKCYAEYIGDKLNVRCTNAMNTKPSTGGSGGGGIEYVSGNYINIASDNSINLKYDTEIAAGSSGIPTSQAVYAITSNKLDLSTFNGHISDFNEHVNSIDKDGAIHMGKTARQNLSMAYDHVANEITFYDNHLASGDKDKLNYSYSTIASLASNVETLNSSSKNWNATSTLVGDNYSNWNWAYTTVSENYSKWDAKSDIQVSTKISDDATTVPTTKAVYEELTNKLNTSMFNTHVDEFNEHVNTKGLHLTYDLNHNISQAYGHLTSELYSSIHVSDEDRTKWDGFEERINELASLGLSYKVLEEGEELPEPSENYSGWVYLTKNSQSENNSYDEWICVIIDGDNTSCAYDDVYKWERIGSTEIDLTDYVKTQALNEYVTNSDFKNHTDTANIHVTKEEKDKIDEQISTITTIISSIDSNVDALNKAVDEHTDDVDIHVTSEDKENWNKISELNNYVTNTTFNSHTSNNTDAKHVTEEEKENWNSKIDNVKSGQYIEVTDNNKVSVITSSEIVDNSNTVPTTKAVYDFVELNKHDISHKFDNTNNVKSFEDGTITFSDGTTDKVDVQKAVIAKYLFRGNSTSTIEKFNTRKYFNLWTGNGNHRNKFYYEYDVFDTKEYDDDITNGKENLSTLQNVINAKNLFLRSRLTIFNDDLSCLMCGFQMFANSKNLAEFRSALPSLTNGIKMFYGCSALTKFETKLPNLVLAECMFAKDMSKPNIENNLEEINTCLPNLTHAQGMFGGCSNLSKLRFSKNSFQCLYNAQDMFNGCSSLTSFHYELPYLETADDMFAGCKLDLESVKIIAESLPSFGVKGQDGCAEDGRKHVITFGLADGVAEQSVAYKTLMEHKGWVVEGIDGNNPIDISKTNDYIIDASAWNTDFKTIYGSINNLMITNIEYDATAKVGLMLNK